MDMLVSVLSAFKHPATMLCYSQDDKALPTQKFVEGFKSVVEYLGDRETLLDYVTFADLTMLECVEYAEFVSDGKIFDTYPTLKTFRDRMVELPPLKAYYASDRFFKGPFNNTVAKINN